MDKIYKIPDLDLDINHSSRKEMIDTLPLIQASRINEQGIHEHPTGYYMCDIPTDKITKLASISYDRGENEYGYIKFDFIASSVYDKFSKRTELFETLNKPIIWSKLYDKDIVETLPHISNYYTLLNDLPKIDSIEKLAMFIAIIRPAKQYLIETVKETQSWESVENKIWVKEENGYQYKKSHSISYALMISLLLR